MKKTFGTEMTQFTNMRNIREVKIMKAAKLKRTVTIMLATACLFLVGCPEEEVNGHASLDVLVFAGNRSENECQSLSSGNNQEEVLVCPGEDVTIFWTSDGISQIDINPTIGTVSSSGIAYLTMHSDTAITVTPLDGTEEAIEIMVDVIDGYTPKTYPAEWASTWEELDIEINDAFVSTNVRAVSISAQWQPTMDLGQLGEWTAIVTDNRMSFTHREEGYEGIIAQPNVEVGLSRPLQLPGQWHFALTDRFLNVVCSPHSWAASHHPDLEDNANFVITVTNAP